VLSALVVTSCIIDLYTPAPLSNSSSQVSLCPHLAARCSGVLSVLRYSQAISKLQSVSMSTQPVVTMHVCCEHYVVSVSPHSHLSRLSTVAPRRSSSATTARCPSAAALCNGVLSLQSPGSNGAPALSSRITAASCTVAAQTQYSYASRCTLSSV
jgi:hypothetical protein